MWKEIKILSTGVKKYYTLGPPSSNKISWFIHSDMFFLSFRGKHSKAMWQSFQCATILGSKWVWIVDIHRVISTSGYESSNFYPIETEKLAALTLENRCVANTKMHLLQASNSGRCTYSISEGLGFMRFQPQLLYVY